MKKLNLITSALFASSLALAGTANAHDNHEKHGNHFSFDNSCSINLSSGVTITPDHVKVFEGNKVLYRINKDGEMTVNGQSVDLDASTQSLAAEYGQGLRDSVPQAAEIAFEAMEVASVGVSTALGAIFGENSDIEYKVTDIIDRAKDKLQDKFDQQGDSFTIAPDSFDNMDDIFGPEFEKEIEQVAMSSMGSIFTIIGEAMSSGEGDFEQRMEAFGAKMEKMGEELEQTLEAQTARIEDQAEELCGQLVDIDKIETQLQNKIPEMKDYGLIEVE